jgi:heat shock protein HslJ
MNLPSKGTHFATVVTLLLALSSVFGILSQPIQAQGKLKCDETYTVQQGDWLSKIAQRYYGDPLAYDRLVTAANADSGDEYTDIENPDLIEPGWLLCIEPNGQTGQPAEPIEGSTSTTPQLVGPVWQWQQTQMNDNSVWEPADPANYTVQFAADGTVAIQADCNQVQGSYTSDDSSLSITLGPSTMAACGPQSIADQFLAQLGGAAITFFQNGRLFIDLLADSGTMQFSAAGEAGSQQAPAATPTALHKTWQWQKRVNPADGSETAVNNPASYTLTFNPDGTYQFRVDCNSGSGSYTANESGAIRFQPGPVTLAECGPDSRYNDMLNMMQAVQDYRLEENGAVLVLVWPAGGPEDVYRTHQ